MAERLDAPELLSSALVVRGAARSQLGERDGVAEIARGIAVGAGVPHHQHAMTGYACLVQELWRTGMFTEADARIEEGMAYAHERRLDLSVACLRGYHHRLELLRGQWDAADTGLRAMATAGGDGGDAERGTARHGLAALALLSVRRGGDDAAELVGRAREQARRTGSRYEVVPAAFAEVEHAWVLRRPAQARDALEVLHGRTGIEGAERERGALRRWMRRLGLPATAFPGCPEEFAADLAGDWRAAAEAWARIGDPYERALELADSGEIEPTEEALRIFDDLGARPAAAMVRKRLRDLGVTRIPRGPAVHDPRPPGRPHRASDGDPRSSLRGSHQRRDRGASGAVGAHG